MKELSIEEKAKAYDKAIEELRGLLEGVHEEKCEIMEEDIIKIFPTLKESEDENVRKFVQYIKKEAKAYEINLPNRDYDIYAFAKDILSWLEKQGNCYLSHDDEIMIRQLTEYFTTGKGLQNTNDTVVEWLTDIKRKLEKQDKQKPDEEYNITGIHSKHTEGKLGEMIKNLKSAWSEDEKIRKAIIDFLQETIDNVGESPNIWTMDNAKKWIAWLEKRGEHVNFINKIQIGDKVTRNEDGVLVNLSQLNRVAKKDEKQGEQKPQGKSALEATNEEKVDNANKVEPRFKAGDFVRSKYNKAVVLRIEEVCNDIYKTERGGYIRIEFQDDWELMEKKPAWSEEDESILNEAIYFIRREPYRERDAEPIVDWLKSLKDRVQPQSTWKPSDEQMRTLEHYTHTLFCTKHKEILFGLYTDLKKLKR